ncbi:MAG TPA: GNAT family N-acetyltransferase [Burkholderiaceae bacterium]|nr:GNAT family N-acetyltransferase [Burkholderiaceae bacterium]
MRSPLPPLATARLHLRPTDAALAPAVADYLQRNRAAHAPWNPPMPEALFTPAGQVERLTSAMLGEVAGTQAGWFLTLATAPDAVIGHLRLSQIARGPFCSAMLGYAIDAAHEGRGLMREALQAALAHAFGPLGLHRVQANARPENTRSLALLARLGFVREGLARDYLFIDGAWRDHVLTACLNPHWPADRLPPA